MYEHHVSIKVRIMKCISNELLRTVFLRNSVFNDLNRTIHLEK